MRTFARPWSNFQSARADCGRATVQAIQKMPSKTRRLLIAGRRPRPRSGARNGASSLQVASSTMSRSKAGSHCPILNHANGPIRIPFVHTAQSRHSTPRPPPGTEIAPIGTFCAKLRTMRLSPKNVGSWKADISTSREPTRLPGMAIDYPNPWD